MDYKTEEIAAKHLGKKVSGSETYDPSLLVAVPRDENRLRYGIKNENLPFCGFDIWHAYEFSSMTKNGIPVTRVMKLKYSCESEYIVESKSLKLYLNSFNMTPNGETVCECLDISKMLIENDLSKTLNTVVSVHFLENTAPKIEVFNGFENLMDYVDEKSLKIENFKESPELLTVRQRSDKKTHCLMFDSLRSNCRVTHQPDFGDVFIYYKSSKQIDEASLVKYLCSFRSEYHFHEECCEMIYKRIYDLSDDEDELFVCALYTRRGGIDICPVRWSPNLLFEDISTLIDITRYARHGIKQ